jgi:hypothetical protein
MSKNVRAEDRKIYSYNTVIYEILHDGRTVGNITRYSATTSKHQSQHGVRGADILVDNVPIGANSLARYIKED